MTSVRKETVVAPQTYFPKISLDPLRDNNLTCWCVIWALSRYHFWRGNVVDVAINVRVTCVWTGFAITDVWEGRGCSDVLTMPCPPPHPLNSRITKNACLSNLCNIAAIERQYRDLSAFLHHKYHQQCTLLTPPGLLHVPIPLHLPATMKRTCSYFHCYTVHVVKSLNYYTN